MTAVEWLVEQLRQFAFDSNHHLGLGDIRLTQGQIDELEEEAKEMESKQLFLASNTSAKDAYKAGQKTMQCGCYEISDALTYEEWLYENFKSEEDESK
jgi:hypothetical protein